MGVNSAVQVGGLSKVVALNLDHKAETARSGGRLQLGDGCRGTWYSSHAGTAARVRGAPDGKENEERMEDGNKNSGIGKEEKIG